MNTTNTKRTKRTSKEIEELALEIKAFLDDHEVAGDTRIYFNGKCLEHSYGDEFSSCDTWKTINNINPADYFDYASGFICMSFEGDFYEVMNYSHYSVWPIADAFENLLHKHGCYCELGNSWNLSIYDE